MHALLESFLTDIFTALPGLVIRGLILIVLFIIWPKLLGMILTTYKKTLEKMLIHYLKVLQFHYLKQLPI